MVCSPASVTGGPEAFSLRPYSPDLLTAAVPVNSYKALLLQCFVNSYLSEISQVHPDAGRYGDRTTGLQ
jgi:hypothetical protein